MEAADSAAGERPVDGEEKNTEGSEGAGEERAAGPPSPAKEASGEGPAEAASGKAVSSDAKSEASASLEGGDGGAFRRESSSSLNLNLNLNEASPKASAVEEDRGLRPSPSSLSPSMAAQSQSAVAASEPLKTGASGRKHRSSVSFASPDGPSRDDNEAGALRRELGVASARTHGGNAAKAEASASAGNVSGGGLWQRVLQEARLKSSLPRKSFVVLLGGEDVGKSSLVRQLQVLGSSAPSLSAVEMHENTGGVSPLDFAFIGVRKLLDEEDVKTADVETTSQVWILQRPQDWELVPPRLQPLEQGKQLSPCLFLITLDLKKAPHLLRQLQTWRRVVEKISDLLMQSLDTRQQEELRERQEKYLFSYRRQTLSHLASRAQTESFGLSLPPVEQTAEKLEKDEEGFSSSPSLPFPVVVCVTRSDWSAEVGSQGSPQALEILEAYLRRECLKMGAALVFTSCKDSENPLNVLILYRYLMHRLFGYPFREEAVLGDTQRLFLPSGWDSLAEVEALVKTTPAGDFERPFEEFVSEAPSQRTVGAPCSAKVSVQSTQAFLQQLQKQNPNATVSASTASEPLAAMAVKGTSEAATALWKKGEVGSGPLRQTSLLSAATAALLPPPSSSRGLQRLPSGSREAPQSLRSSGSGSKTEGLPEGGGDQESLQNFFQGLMQKSA